MTELSALAGSEGYAACDDEAKDMQLATTKRASNWPPLAVNRGAERSAGLHRPLMEPTKCRMHFVGEEEQRND